MCHTHTIYSTAWAATRRLLDLITQDATVFFENYIMINDEAGNIRQKRTQV